MSTDRWLRVKAITSDALERAETERPSFPTNTGDLPAAPQTYRQTLVQMSGLAAAAPQSVPYRRGVGIAGMKIGDITHLMHDHQAAFAFHRQAEHMLRALSRESAELVPY